MATIVTRAGKGSPLTNTEVDDNFTNLNTDKVENLGDLGITSTATELNKLDGFTGTKDDLNYAKDLRATGVTSTEYDYLDGVTSNIQTQLDNKLADSNPILDAISTSIADTAVDVFVYDTRKDSDGGAWRKRCQHTSWYNETLNTATRGSRKEFPAVAVIVAETGVVTIYDGDDPDMPMWMVFNGAGNLNNYVMSTYVTSVSFKNGILSIGANNTGSLTIVNFLSDKIAALVSTTTNYGNNVPVVRRNDSDTGSTLNDFYGALVNRNVNDVAMTVLPNAPIDDATGLPIPTIAVATDGGVSVIKDDGTVVSHINTASYDTAYQVDFLDNYRYIAKFNETTSASQAGVFVVENFTSSSPTFNIYNSRNVYSSSYGPAVATYVASNGGVPKNLPAIHTREKEFAVAGYFLAQVSEGNTLPSGMVNYISSSYNTGWMNGDIKLATLSDTDDTDFSESSANLVTNGEFSTSDLSSYSDVITEGGTETFSVSGGTATYSISGAGNYAHRRQNVAVEAGKTYQITTYISAASGSNARVEARANGTGTLFPSYLNNGGEWFATGQNADGSSTNGTSPVGTHVATLVCTTSGNLQVGFRAYQNGSVSANYIRVREIAAVDRSVNRRGLVGIGSLTKSAVATGADLVAYSGFSASNYLQQPYNSDLDFGTGDFCVMGWVKLSSIGSEEMIFDRAQDTLNRLFLRVGTDGKIMLYTRQSSGVASVTTSSLSANNWAFIVGTRASGTQHIYFNGVLQDSDASSLDLTFTSGVTRFGADSLNSASTILTNGSLALWRISATAPSAEQIKKIYEDEKVLFQENAQATLYGSSDAVTALAYDDDTNILSVGTSAGRSDFSGLRRVNNTTTAVTTAISSSNGMVVEQ
jgi:hypothetical protein